MEKNGSAAGGNTSAASPPVAREDFTIEYRHSLITVKAGQVIDDPEFLDYLQRVGAPVE